MAKKKKRTGGGEQPKPASDVAEDKPAEDTSPDVQQPHLNAATTTAAPGTDDKDASTKADDPKKDAKEKEKKPAALPVVTAVLNVDMHCDGCAKRIRASIRHYPGELSLHPSSSASTPSLLILLCSISVDRTGVEGVAMEVDKGTMTVVGRFDAKKLRDRVANKTKKKVDLLPNNKKAGDDNDNKNNKANECDGKPADKKQQQQEDDGDEAGKEDKKKKKEKEEQDDQKKKKAKDNKKPVVPVPGTVVLKIGAVGLHCDGCMNRIRTKLFHIQGVEQVAMEMAKNQVTVTGTMDIKALPEKLRKKLRRPVDVVPPGKQKDKDGGKDKDKEKQDGGKDGGGGGKDAAAKALTAEKEAWKAAFYDQQALLATDADMQQQQQPLLLCGSEQEALRHRKLVANAFFRLALLFSSASRKTCREGK
ncbi:Os02g0819000 [Oryza sativa Japonica Group]|uniref:Os02g0819000 protein n=1 Tax=Oryza sativa subsp. japonica TaxID=39947 RepID=C7IZ65_ORYSJ|nr:Os02g0819000 [Oryza sativa Japonica Group]|eukprot:NP_001173210.1 Os02g0819000 [Oryza sativa Japonica Group]